MTLSIQLPDDVEKQIRRRASDSGLSLDSYVSKLVRHLAAAPAPLETISGPIYRHFLESGSSEDELIEELEQAKHELRAERRARGA